MSEFMKLAIVFISMLVLFYFLWVNGYMILNAKRALLFVVSLRVNITGTFTPLVRIEETIVPD